LSTPLEKLLIGKALFFLTSRFLPTRFAVEIERLKTEMDSNQKEVQTPLATFPTLFDPCTSQKIRERFARVNDNALSGWFMTAGLNNSTQSRRMNAVQLT